jgi:uncharacterized protein (TIGR03086 family)
MATPDRRRVLIDAYENAAVIVSGIRPDQLRNATPCPGYDVAGMIDHVVEAGRRAAALGRGQAPPSGDASPHVELTEAPERLRNAAQTAAAAWVDDTRLVTTAPMPWGEQYTGAALIDMYLLELTAHAWDLAWATGQLDRLDATLAAPALSGAHAFIKPEFRDMVGPGAPFGAEVPPPSGANDWERFVAFTGRHPRARITRFTAAEQADEWNSRYREPDGAMWSGRPNGRLVVEVAGLTPGRALDVGCGEGADAIWLAQGGWTVTAIDISQVALGRARAAAELARTAVAWICGDALQASFPAGEFDLVSVQYPALPKVAGEVAVRALLDTVRPGGLLLAVYHDLNDEHREHMKARGVDPADYIDADDLSQLLDDDFTVERAVEPRIDPPPDNPHIADVIVRARRR